MAKSQTNYSTNASNNLNNDASGLANNVTPGLENYLGGIGGAQGQQQNTLNTLTPALTQNLSTGGYDPGQLSGLRNEFSNFSSTGGYDPSNLSTINSGYTKMANTGGFTPEQEQQFVRQATEGTTATGNILQDQARRSQVATGGLGGGSADAQIQRQMNQQQSTGTLNAEVALNQQENANKFSGLQGLSSSSSDIAGKKIAGGALQSGLESGVAAGSTAAAGQMNQLFNTQTNQVTQMGQQMLSALGLSYNSQAEAASILQKLSQNPGMFQTVFGDILAAGGAAAGAATGLGVHI